MSSNTSCWMPGWNKQYIELTMILTQGLSLGKLRVYTKTWLMRIPHMKMLKVIPMLIGARIGATTLTSTIALAAGGEERVGSRQLPDSASPC